MHVDTLKFYKYTPVKKPVYKDKFCHQPFNNLQIDADGDVQLCDCQMHMPFTIGNVYENTLQQIWNGHLAAQVRQSVADGDFTYCNWSCASLPNLPTRSNITVVAPDFPTKIKIDLDLSCNLHCPSCRERPIMEKHTAKIQKQIEIFEQIKTWAVENPNRTLRVTPLSSGEVFASHSGLNFLNSLSDFPGHNLQLEITSNGTLINRNRAMLSNISHLLKSFSISVDAATPETYAKVRGGDWNELMLGIQFVTQELQIPLRLNFCVQKNNWHEIGLFADLAHGFGATVIYQKLLDWGHWTIAWWHDNNVFDRTKQSRDTAIEQLILAKQNYPNKVMFGAELAQMIQKSNSEQI